MITFRNRFTRVAIAGLLSASGGLAAQDTQPPAREASAPGTTASASTPGSGSAFITTEVVKFKSPWAMTFLPDGRLLVTEMAGTLQLFDPASGKVGNVSGVPKVTHVAQGGLGDVVLHPRFATNKLVYISFVEPGEGRLGAAVARARLALDEQGGGKLEGLKVIWRQVPKKSGDGHFGYRIAFDRDGMLWISSSERKEFTPAQEMDTNLGKIVRLADDGSVPSDNPFAAKGGVAAQVWTLGHRNILGIAFDASGQLWAQEMGPMGGDELNRIERGANYGYPIVSNGDHYDGTPIPDHPTRPEFRAPVITWNPVISPAGLMFYDGALFPEWKGDAFVGGLSSMSLVRIEFDAETAREAQRFDMQRRIREVEQGPDGAIWLLEDGTREGSGWLLKLTPKAP
jgi:glucose/arabinose dehydrogenase